MITLVVTPAELDGEAVKVEGAAYRHLFRARRLESEAVVRVVDGKGRARLGRARSIEATSARIVLGAAESTNEPKLYLELMTPLPKASRLSWMVEKATEIGVSAIRLLSLARAPRRASDAMLARLGRVAVAAVEQSQRAVVPVISGAHDFSELPILLETLQERHFLLPGTTRTRVPGTGPRLALLVGPEGGWTKSEIEQLGHWACQPMGLGPTVLRIETAAVVGSASLLMRGPGG